MMMRIFIICSMKCALFFFLRLIAMKFGISYTISNWYSSSIYLLLEAIGIFDEKKKLYRFKRIEDFWAHQQL